MTNPTPHLTDEEITALCALNGLGPCLGLTVGRAIESLLLSRLSADQYKAASDEWLAKTNWVQDEIQRDVIPDSFRYLGKHRADVMREEIERLRAEVTRLSAGAEPVALDDRSAWLTVRMNAEKCLSVPPARRVDPPAPAQAGPTDAQLLALVFDDPTTANDLMPRQREAAIARGRERWEAFNRAAMSATSDAKEPK